MIFKRTLFNFILWLWIIAFPISSYAFFTCPKIEGYAVCQDHQWSFTILNVPAGWEQFVSVSNECQQDEIRHMDIYWFGADDYSDSGYALQCSYLMDSSYGPGGVMVGSAILGTTQFGYVSKTEDPAGGWYKTQVSYSCGHCDPYTPSCKPSMCPIKSKI